MAQKIVKTCDICKKVFEGNEKVNIKGILNTTTSDIVPFTFNDVCEECGRKVYDYFHSLVNRDKNQW